MVDRDQAQLGRLARCALDIEHKRALCAELQRVLQRAEDLGLPTAAARRTHAQLCVLLEQVWALLAELQEAPSPAGVDAIERVLANPLWVSAQAMLTELTASAGQRQEKQELLTPAALPVAHTAAFARHADLLLVRSERTRRAYRYTLVLRTPAASGAHGVNIQDTSTIVEEDHLRLRRAVREITALINSGLARQFSAAQAASSSESGAPTETGSAPADSANVNDLARQTGALMYDLLLPQDMQGYLRETPCSITITSNDLELPWELLYDAHGDGAFLCLDRPVARMPMGRAYPRPVAQATEPSHTLRFALIYADPTGNLPAAAAEVRQIARDLRERWGASVQVDVFERAAADGERLNAVLRGGAYDVIHYAGHARFDTAQPEESALLLHRGELLPAEKIGRLLNGRPLVFVNACESGKTANEKKPQAVGRYLQRPAEGLATSFIYGGALAYIGSVWPVYDDAAAAFAVAFYNDLIAGHTLGEAMRRTRQQSKLSYPRQMTWASFVLYGDPTARLTG